MAGVDGAAPQALGLNGGLNSPCGKSEFLNFNGSVLRAHAVCGWCRIAFTVSMETRLGEHVCVVGSHEKLGCWDPRKGVPLNTTPDTYPTWSGSVELDLQGFDYKFVVIAPCGTVKWEVGANRNFMLFQPTAMPVELLSPPAPKPQPRMCRRGSCLPAEVQLPTLLAQPTSPPSSPKKADAPAIEWEALTPVEKLGAGQYGVVKLVKDSKDNLFAWKSQAMEVEKKRCWHAELTALKACGSAFIVQMKDPPKGL